MYSSVFRAVVAKMLPKQLQMRTEVHLPGAVACHEVARSAAWALSRTGMVIRRLCLDGIVEAANDRFDRILSCEGATPGRTGIGACSVIFAWHGRN